MSGGISTILQSEVGVEVFPKFLADVLGQDVGRHGLSSDFDAGRDDFKFDREFGRVVGDGTPGQTTAGPGCGRVAGHGEFDVAVFSFLQEGFHFAQFRQGRGVAQDVAGGASFVFQAPSFDVIAGLLLVLADRGLVFFFGDTQGFGFVERQVGLVPITGSFYELRSLCNKPFAAGTRVPWAWVLATIQQGWQGG